MKGIIKKILILFVLIIPFAMLMTVKADSGWDTDYGGGGGYSGGYSDWGDVSVDSGSGGGIYSGIFYSVIAIIIIVTTIVKAIEKSQIRKERDRQIKEDSKLQGLTNDEIKAVDENLSIQILAAIAMSAYEKYANNLGNSNKLKSIFTDELKEKFDFDYNKKRTIENISFEEIRIIEIKKEDHIEFKAYYIVKCNDYMNSDKKDRVVYNKIIFTIINIEDLWLIKDIED